MTDNKEPTQEQIKEFWEWCGLHKHIFENVDYTAELPYWRCGLCGKRFWTEAYNGKDDLPNPLDMDIDLNNLFQYAVPKLGNEFDFVQLQPKPDGWLCIIRGLGFQYRAFYYDDPALALFWAIWEVIHND